MKITQHEAIQKGALIARMSVVVPKMGIEIHNISVFNKNGKMWFKMPQYPTDEVNEKGYKVWKPHIEFIEPKLDAAFQGKLREAYHLWITENQAV